MYVLYICRQVTDSFLLKLEIKWMIPKKIDRNNYKDIFIIRSSLLHKLLFIDDFVEQYLEVYLPPFVFVGLKQPHNIKSTRNNGYIHNIMIVQEENVP